MAIDVYALCPCGSGKKIKFCCHDIVHDMQAVLQLQQDGQPRMALKALEKVEARAPQNTWMLSVKAGILADEDRIDELLEVVERLLTASPNHPFGLYLRAIATFRQKGYEAALPVIEQAFEHGLETNPRAMASLVELMIAMFGQGNKFMALRQCLNLFPALVGPEERELALKGLMDFDGTHGIPYPLRGPYPLRTREQVGITDPELERAWHLADRAAWGSAARAFAAAAERHPKNGALAYNAGLCLAWSGDQQAAAAALHRAAPLQADFETAVETEALAQLLDESLPEHQTPMFQQKFRVQVASRLLTRLGEHPTFIRTTIPPPDEDDRTEQPVGLFGILDRPPLEAGQPAGLGTTPQVLAELVIYDADNRSGSRLPDPLETGRLGRSGSEIARGGRGGARNLGRPRRIRLPADGVGLPRLQVLCFAGDFPD
jgi:tetratricopeptide (TPR) repeat protein